MKYEDEGGEFEATLNFIGKPALDSRPAISGRDMIIECLRHNNPAPLDILIHAARKEIKELKEQLVQKATIALPRPSIMETLKAAREAK